MLLEVREREREREHAQQLQDQLAQPVIPLQPGLLAPAVVVQGTFEWLDDASTFSYYFTLSCIIVSYGMQ